MAFKKTTLYTEIAALTAAALLQSATVGAQQATLEEVVVTATRRSQSVQDIPYNISAISGDSIRRQGAFDVNDITRSIPGVAGPDLGSRSGVSNSIIMRGINVSDPGQGSVTRNLTVAAVSTYLNETPLFTNFRMVDLERVEVLRGPQGTLYGSGAMGGTLRFITRKPDFESSSAELTLGLAHNEESSDLNYEAQGVFNLPISDTLALRAALSYEERGGVVDATNLMVFGADGIPTKVDPANPDSPAATRTEKDADTGEVLFTRLNLLWTPSDLTEVNINYLHQDEEWGHSTTTYIGDDKSLSGGADAWEDSPRFLDEVDRTVDMGSVDIEHDFGFATFTSASSFSVDDSTPNRDTSDFYETLSPLYWGYPRMNALDESDIETEVFTQEFRLVSNGDGPFDWVVGAYYQQEDIEQNNVNHIRGFGEWADDPNSGGSQAVAYYYGAAGLTTVGDFVEFGLGGIRPSTNGDLGFTSSYESEFTDLAAFGELTWHVTDAWQFTVGARFFKQELDASLRQTLPYCGAGCSDDGLDPNGLTNASSDSEFDDQIFKFNTSYDFAEDQMAYLTVSEGFRRGGANALPQLGPFFDPGFAVDYEPDTLLNTELGLKGTLMDNRLSYSAAVYQITWDDIQLETFNSAGFRGVVNGDEAQSKGLELEATFAATQYLTITAGYSYVDAEITEDSLIADRSGAGLPSDMLFDGDTLPYVSENQASISLDYSRALDNGMMLDIHLDGNYRSEFNSQVNDELFFDNYVEFDGYSQWNTSLSLSKDAWRATLWSRNLTNEEGLSSAVVRNANVTPGAEFGRRGFVSRPRTVGLRFTYFFE
jgi:outer membrane receptor protein involved in Fe transport